MDKTLCEDEKDLFIEIYLNTMFFNGVLETSKTLKSNMNDRKSIINLYKKTTNNIINTALQTEQKFDFFKEKNLTNITVPDNFKPGSVKLLQMVNKLNKTQTKLALEFVENLLTKNKKTTNNTTKKITKK